MNENKNKVMIYHQLCGIYKGIVSMDDDEINDVVDTLKSINIKSIADYYIEISGNKEFDDMDLMTCKKLIEILQYIYNNTSVLSPISDDDYDKLYQVILDRGIGDIVGSINGQGKPLRAHSYPELRGTLNKVHYMFNVDKNGDKRRSVEDWVRTIESIIGRNITNSERYDIWLQPKWDGVSVVFECDENGNLLHALLRGDTEKNVAIDVTKLFIGQVDFRRFANKVDKFGIKTEVLMNRASYEAICKEYKQLSSPRSATTSIVNEKVLQPELCKYLDIKPLRIQYEGKKPVLITDHEYDRAGNLYHMRELQYRISEINERVRENGLSTDGVVLVIWDKELQRTLGRDGAINRFEVAYKFPAEEQKTILEDVVFSIGLGGNVTPVAKIKVVEMNGKNIRSISLGSIDRFISLNLHRGDEVIVKYEIIPYLDVDSSCRKNPDGEQFIVPVYCKYCNCKLEEDPMLKCVNEDCSSRIIGNVVNYINKMRIENISIETVTTFFDQGYIKGIESLYTLEDYKNDIIQLPGFGVKSYEKIINGINSKMEVYDYELMGSIGIPNIGERIFKKVLSIMSLETLLETSKDHMLIGHLVSLPGFGEKTATKIQKGINSKLVTIYYLLSKLTLKDKGNSSKSKGKVCFTKVRDGVFESSLVNKGYEVSDSLTKETTILVVPALDIVSSKIEKAKKYGIQIITLDDAIRTL